MPNYTISLDPPPPEANKKNKYRHWAETYKVVKPYQQYLEDAFKKHIKNGLMPASLPLPVQLHISYYCYNPLVSDGVRLFRLKKWYLPKDADNAKAACWPIQDAMQAVGLVPNDSYIGLGTLRLVKDTFRTGLEVVIECSENSEDFDNDMEKLQSQIVQWGKDTFPHSTLVSIMQHFCEEAIEFAGIAAMREALEHAVERMNREPERMHQKIGTMEEAADCALLLTHFLGRQNVSLYDAIRFRFSTIVEREYGPNPYTRYWKGVDYGKEGQDGTYKHILSTERDDSRK